MGSSSSDDSVRSITAGAGRLALCEPVRGAEWPSLPPELISVYEVMFFLGVSIRRPLMLISDTSKSSSSSSSSRSAPFGLDNDSSFGGLLNHLPLGSMVTVSRLFDVFSRMALT